eukprot:Unigene7225_Nuclearia_a/m.22182 Unigene7225_Nuclearia_a/g.22182  ORF Unigene7225_Nuclearia_a/g.22182 Unigene7225_Nuclearia_a/m.22182 type:complete len:297 (+) Unigene7225_Nuclearia_a:634-1524(+)
MQYFPQYDWLVSYEVMGAAALGYLLSIVVLRAVMEHFDKLDPKRFMQLYNTAQVALCAYMVVGFAQAQFALTNPYGINHAFNAATEWFMLVHYLSKYLDFFDTWIMIVKKSERQLNFLHVYHHTSILLIWGFLLHLGQGNGTAYFGAFINSVIHLIMYSHYLWTSFGYTNPFKMVVTLAQLAQFWICIGHSLMAVIYERVLMPELAYLQFAYHITMIVLFNDFFSKTYKKGDKRDKGEKGERGEKGANGVGANGVGKKHDSANGDGSTGLSTGISAHTHSNGVHHRDAAGRARRDQ